MSDNESSSERKEAEPKTSDVKTAVLLALIEHGSRPVAILLLGLFLIMWLFTARRPLFELLSDAQRLKVGSFELQLRKSTDAADLRPELRALQGLNDEQLQLFLVIGKERKHITYNGEEVTEENLNRLQKAGLLAEVRKEPQGGFWWRVSDKGFTLHNIIRTLVLDSIRRAAAA
jgi:hypothetical protein